MVELPTNGNGAFVQGGGIRGGQLIVNGGVVTVNANSKPATMDLMDSFGAKLGRIASGFQITDIKADSPADKAGLQIGDLITKVGESDVDKLENVKDALTKSEADKPLKIKISRKDNPLTVTIPTK